MIDERLRVSVELRWYGSDNDNATEKCEECNESTTVKLGAGLEKDAPSVYCVEILDGVSVNE